MVRSECQHLYYLKVFGGAHIETGLANRNEEYILNTTGEKSLYPCMDAEITIKHEIYPTDATSVDAFKTRFFLKMKP